MRRKNSKTAYSRALYFVKQGAPTRAAMSPRKLAKEFQVRTATDGCVFDTANARREPKTRQNASPEKNYINEESIELLYQKKCWTPAPSNLTIAHLQLGRTFACRHRPTKSMPRGSTRKMPLGCQRVIFELLSNLGLPNCLNATTAKLFRPEEP